MNRKCQYGLLFALYICRAGRATVEIAAKTLDLSKNFLHQVARELKIAGILKSIRGLGGGYELVGQPTVGAICFALSGMALVHPGDLARYRRGEFEHRAFARAIDDFHFSLTPVFKRKIINLGTELVSAELAQMDKTNGKAH